MKCQWDIVKDAQYNQVKWRLKWRDSNDYLGPWDARRSETLQRILYEILTGDYDVYGYRWKTRDQAARFRAALNAELQEAKKTKKQAKQDRIVSVIRPTITCPHCGETIEIEVKEVK